MPTARICSQNCQYDKLDNEVDECCPDYELAALSGYSGYFASSEGHIVDNRTGDILHEWDDRGRRRVRIGKATEMVHNLILRAFTGKPLVKGYFPRWRNGDKADNRPENLMWAGRPR